MNRPILAFALALAVSPLAGLAQTETPASPAPPPRMGVPPAPGTPPRMVDVEALRQSSAQLATLRTQERAQILAALTPAHKQLLAQIAGQLALGTIADTRAAAAQLNAALTPQESQAIVAADTSYRTQRRALTTASRQAAIAVLPADVKERIRSRAERAPGSAPNPDAGLIVMRATIGQSNEFSSVTITR